MIGICIKYYHENYGGMLQAFATTQVFDRMLIPYELIRYEKKKSIAFAIKSLPRLLNRVLVNDKYELIQKKINLKRHSEFGKNNVIRMKAFAQFRETHFTKLSPTYVGFVELRKAAAAYTAVVTGSDQLWSPAGLPTNFYNLQFVPVGVRKISYASSFGVKNIPWYQRLRTAAFLNRIEYISMREKRGAENVKALVGRDVPVVLDPVFMFNADQWNMLIPVELQYNEPYIFAYLLGNNSEQRKSVVELSRKSGLKVVSLRHLDQYVEEDENFGDYAPYDVGPTEFLNLIRGAQYICTDSFHGSVFSIIYRKQFIIFNRYCEQSKHSKNSRIDTLCKNLALEERRFNKDIAVEMTKYIDYDAVSSKFSVLKASTDKYLVTAFQGIR
jgi:hypothetical protein